MAEKKRDTTRVEFHTRGELQSGETRITGRVENLSLKGMLLVPEESAETLDVGADVLVSIQLAGAASNLALSLEGRVVRMDEGGIGLEFTEMEFDTFVHLRNIVAYNAGDEEKIMEEFTDTFE